MKQGAHDLTDRLDGFLAGCRHLILSLAWSGVNRLDRWMAESVVKPFLRAQGVDRLPMLLLTQGGYPACWHFPSGQIVTSYARFRSPAYRDLLAKTGQLARTMAAHSTG